MFMYVILTPREIALLACLVLGKWLGCQSRILNYEINTLIKEAFCLVEVRENHLHLSTMMQRLNMMGLGLGLPSPRHHEQ